ncbi:EthD domain-containing protein [Solimonas flava]|uniref:EthD domain-containing protein n=1 Tax=Solimonas flava TaxID=415849 RepID=UPI0003FAFF88|nr:EthD domain-containing protein [Solimonas flava]
MEKILYLGWRDPAQSRNAFFADLRERLAPALQAAGARGLRLNLDDDAVREADGIRQRVFDPPPDALLQVWVDSAIGFLRSGIDAAVTASVPRHAAYLVTESQAIVNRAHPPQPGLRTEGFAQLAILRRPPRLSPAQWLDIWHNGHTPVGIETQSNFEYVQNVVVRPLTPDAPAIDAIVEECFPAAAMRDPYVFFDAAGDEAKFRRNLERMMTSVHRFIDPGTIDVIPSSQYRMF